MSKSTSDSNKAVVAKPQTHGLFSGIENPSGAAFAGFAFAYVLLPPAIFMMTQPGGYVQSAVETLWKAVLPGAASVPKDRVIPALATIYATFAYGMTGGVAVAGTAMSRKQGLDLEHPRAHREHLKGFPLRLKSAHDHLMEAFPMWAIAAGLAQLAAPKNQQLINMLGLGMLLKVGVHYPAYLFNIAPVRSFAHLFATAASTAALYAVATGAR